MNWFLELVQQGNLEKVHGYLSGATEDMRDRLLKEKTSAGFNAGRLAVERNDENMLDLLLQYMSHFHVTKLLSSDRMSVFTRAVQVNPGWFSKFQNVDTRELLFMRLASQVDDLDNQEKYCQLWNEFTTISTRYAHAFMDKLLRKRHKTLASWIFNVHGRSLKTWCLKQLLWRAMEQENHCFFKQALDILPEGEHLFHVRKLGGTAGVNPKFIEIFFDSGREITEWDIHMLAAPAIPSESVEAFLVRGLFFECFFHRGLRVGGWVSRKKFALFLEAGFFTAYENIFATIVNREEKNTEADHSYAASTTDAPLLASLALSRVRLNLLQTHRKNITYIFRQGLEGHLPAVLQNQIQHPYSDIQISRIFTHWRKVLLIGSFRL